MRLEGFVSKAMVGLGAVSLLCTVGCFSYHSTETTQPTPSYSTSTTTTPTENSTTTTRQSSDGTVTSRTTTTTAAP